ncbi:MAG: FtsX-like permease family protein [Thermodesulfovibrionales bacterium]
MMFLKLAFKNILRHRIRSLLTIVGIATSVAALFSIISFNRGFERGLSRELERTGIHFMIVPSGCPHEVASLVLHGAVTPKFLDTGVIEKISEIRDIDLISPILVFQIPNKEKNRIDLVYGMEMSHLMKLKPSWKIKGAIPKTEEEIIIGSEIAEHDNIKLGDNIYYSTIKSKRGFKISGILDKTDSQDDAFIYMPISTAQEILQKPHSVTAIGVRVKNAEDINIVSEDLAMKIPGIQIVTMGQIMNSLSSLATSAKILSLAIVSIAILISAVGAMNSILMAIFERTHEIGMMRAIGASRFDIFRIIIIETSIMTSIGGLAGIIFSIIGSGIIEGIVRKFMPYVPSGDMIDIEPWLAALCIVFSLCIGILSGIYPAYKASKITPIEAIKN